ncbi:MAG: hypothetical protein JW888_15660 [Pirellulales bacterium]|nr:hypothetical protein [Pirellulales bacterium]
MALDFDPTNDFAAVADLQQQVTLLRPGTSDETHIAHAVRAAVRASEARSSGGKYTEDDVVWQLDAMETSTRPEPADVIVDAESQRWTILTARRTTTGRWRCVCRNLAIAHGLDQYVDIEVAVYAKDAAGAEVAAWHPWRTGIRARIQPIRAAVEDDHQRRTFLRESKIFVADQLELDQTHRIRAPDGTLYRVAGCEKADRIDALMEINVIREEPS